MKTIHIEVIGTKIQIESNGFTDGLEILRCLENAHVHITNKIQEGVKSNIVLAKADAKVMKDLKITK